jgi:hypothetical protein
MICSGVTRSPFTRNDFGPSVLPFTPVSRSITEEQEEDGEQGGDPACWAQLLCPECGAVLDGGPHREGCEAGATPGSGERRVTLLTLGHGTLGEDDLRDLLLRAGVESLVDVRTAPGSRRHPHVSRAALEVWVPAAGVAYSWEPRLGGWRKPKSASRHTALQNASFRGYADYMETPPFWEALDRVLQAAAARRTAVMCSESVYWRCHRRLLSDAAVLARQAEVLHLGHDGRLTPHRLTAGVRCEDGRPVYDLGVAGQLPGVVA